MLLELKLISMDQCVFRAFTVLNPLTRAVQDMSSKFCPQEVRRPVERIHSTQKTMSKWNNVKYSDKF